MRKFALLQRVVESCPLALWSIPPHHHTQSHIYIYIFHLPKQSHVKSIWKMITRYSTFGPGTVGMSIGFTLVPQPHCSCMHSIHKDHHQPRGKGTSEVRACHRLFVLPAFTCHQHHSAPILFVRFLTNRKVVELLILLTS
jgi:hypothetical protein